MVITAKFFEILSQVNLIDLRKIFFPTNQKKGTLPSHFMILLDDDTICSILNRNVVKKMPICSVYNVNLVLWNVAQCCTIQHTPRYRQQPSVHSHLKAGTAQGSCPTRIHNPLQKIGLPSSSCGYTMAKSLSKSLSSGLFLLSYDFLVISYQKCNKMLYN